MKIVLDTNVLAVAISRRSRYNPIWQSLKRGEFDILIATDILLENDPDDNKFVDCAIAGAADFIVTDDKDFNVLKNISFPKVAVLSSDEFLEMVIQGKI